MYTFLFHGTRPTQIVKKVLSISVPQPPQPLDEARSQRERLQIEAETALGTVGMPPLPASLTAEEVQELTAKIVAEIAASTAAAAAPANDHAPADGVDTDGAHGSESGGDNGAGAAEDGAAEDGAAEDGGGEDGGGEDVAGGSLNDSLTALTSLTGDAVKVAVDEAANVIALKLLTQIQEEESTGKK